MKYSIIPAQMEYNFDSYRCPISKMIMLDPVIAADGCTYERDMIETWFDTNKKSPITNLEISTELHSAITTKQLIEQLLIVKPELKQEQYTNDYSICSFDTFIHLLNCEKYDKILKYERFENINYDGDRVNKSVMLANKIIEIAPIVNIDIMKHIIDNSEYLRDIDDAIQSRIVQLKGTVLVRNVQRNYEIDLQTHFYNMLYTRNISTELKKYMVQKGYIDEHTVLFMFCVDDYDILKMVVNDNIIDINDHKYVDNGLKYIFPTHTNRTILEVLSDYIVNCTCGECTVVKFIDILLDSGKVNVSSHFAEFVVKMFPMNKNANPEIIKRICEKFSKYIVDTKRKRVRI